MLRGAGGGFVDANQCTGDGDVVMFGAEMWELDFIPQLLSTPMQCTKD